MDSAVDKESIVVVDYSFTCDYNNEDTQMLQEDEERYSAVDNGHVLWWW